MEFQYTVLISNYHSNMIRFFVYIRKEKKYRC